MLYFFPSLPSVRPSVRRLLQAPPPELQHFRNSLLRKRSLSLLSLSFSFSLSLVLSQLLLPALEKPSVPITIIMSRNVIWLSWFAVKSKEFERDCCGLWGAAAHGAVLLVLHFWEVLWGWRESWSWWSWLWVFLFSFWFCDWVGELLRVVGRGE